MKPQEFRRQVDAGKIPPVVFLIGDDEYIRRDLIEQLKKKVLAGADALTALELWDGEEQSLEEVLASADQLTFGASQKLLIINNADAFLAGDKVLRPYLENPSPGAVLVFCMEKLDMRRPLAKAMPSTCEVVTVGERYRDQQEVEVQRLLQKYSHLTFDREALTCLRDWVGDNLSALNTELEKIGLAHPHKSPITVADIEGLVFKQEVQSVFAFVDAVANGKRREAMDLLLRLMREGRNPLELFGLIRSQTEKLYLAAEMLEKGKAGPSICQALRVPPYFCNAFLAKAKGAGRTAPSTFFSALYESDKAIKTSLWREDLAAEMLVLKTTARA